MIVVFEHRMQRVFLIHCYEIYHKDDGYEIEDVYRAEDEKLATLLVAVLLFNTQLFMIVHLMQ